jgi:hypothetical protein
MANIVEFVVRGRRVRFHRKYTKTQKKMAIMIDKKIEEAVALGRRLQQMFVATADKKGLPHLAAAAEIDYVAGRQVAVAAWFCPGTIDNLQENRQISLVIWDPLLDEGYQLLGTVESIEDTAMLNGYPSLPEQDPPLPQAERKLIIRVDQILAFSQAPHSDVEE